MRCADMGSLIDLYVGDELPEDLRSQVERHVLQCPQCAHQALTLQQTRAHLQEAMPRQEAPPALRERLAARLRNELADVVHAPVAAEPLQWPLPNLSDRQVP